MTYHILESNSNSSESDQVWEIDKIVDHKVVNGRTMYRVHWKDEKDNSNDNWVDESEVNADFSSRYWNKYQTNSPKLKKNAQPVKLIDSYGRIINGAFIPFYTAEMDDGTLREYTGEEINDINVKLKIDYLTPLFVSKSQTIFSQFYPGKLKGKNKVLDEEHTGE